MGAGIVSDLPDGFMLEQPAAPTVAPASPVPEGFQLEAAPTKPPRSFMDKLGETNIGHAAKAIYSAVTLPGDVVAGKAHVPGSPDAQAIPGAVPYGSPESSGERIADLATIATPASVAQGTGKAIAAVSQAARERVAPSVSALKEAASAGFQSPEVTGLVVKSPTMDNFGTAVKGLLNEAGVEEVLAPKTFGLLSRLEKTSEGKPAINGTNIQTIRRAFGNAANSPDATERLAAKTVIDHLDNFVPILRNEEVIAGNAPAAAKTLETARANYSAAAHAETIDKKAVQAELRAAAANSGQNVSNTIRQRLADILIKPELRRGFKPDELDAMEAIVRGSKPENAMRLAGNLMGGGGGLTAAVTGIASAGIAPAIGFGLKQLSNSLSMRKISQLSELIRSNAPLASSMEKYGERAQAFITEKNPRTRSDFAIATRNLVNNLSAAGISVSARDLAHDLASNQSP